MYIIRTVVPYNLTIEASPGVQVEYTAGLNLTCNAMGGPTLNYSWVLPNGMEEDGSVLVVNMVTEMEDGEYVCTVTSEAGSTSVSISVLGELCVYCVCAVCVCVCVCVLVHSVYNFHCVCSLCPQLV